MHKVAISGTGIFTPGETISNAELVVSYNAYAERRNAERADEIAAGRAEATPMSSEEFILKASGIERRHVMNKSGILDPERMHPILPERSDDELSLMAEISLKAAGDALAKAGRTAADIDAVICAASNHERAYPAIAIEVQQALGVKGFAFDMNVACSSATFGIQAAADMIRSGSARAILMVNPEITSGHQEWRDRDCHFIFGDVCTAVLLERAEDAEASSAYEIVSTRLLTEFSNNIRNNNGFLRRTREGHMEDRRDMLFRQEGRKVFKQVVPMVAELLLTHLADEGLSPDQISRLWLHQANKSMNDLIGQKVLGREPTPDEQPNVLQDYANTSSAGSIIAFSKFSDDLPAGSYGVICSFGAGYSAGSVIVKKLEHQGYRGRLSVFRVASLLLNLMCGRQAAATRNSSSRTLVPFPTGRDTLGVGSEKENLMKRVLIVFAASMLSTAALAQADMRGSAGLDSDQHLGIESEANLSNNGSTEMDADLDATSSIVVDDGMNIDTMSTGSINADADVELIQGPAGGNYSANVDVEDLHR